MESSDKGDFFLNLELQIETILQPKSPNISPDLHF